MVSEHQVCCPYKSLNYMSFDDEYENTAQTKSAPLMERIKDILAETSAERWEGTSEELDPQKKLTQNRQTWEEFFCTDVKSGVLVIRKSTIVKSNYYGGGYFLSEGALPHHTIELRPKGWIPRMLSDPFFRSASGIERKVQVLVEGEIARQLFEQVKETVRVFRLSVKRDFEAAIEHLTPKLLSLVAETNAGDWTTELEDPHTTTYLGEIDGMKVSSSLTVKDLSGLYSLRLSKYGLHWDSRDFVMAKEVYDVVDDCVKHASLEKLGKVLEEML